VFYVLLLSPFVGMIIGGGGVIYFLTHSSWVDRKITEYMNRPY
jgi:hypothetical protein